ncbi:undecaprenyl-diphosphate phosphatase [Deinococcus rubellus]|uniref:Undecaprenyl-diphosphatase n=1 Tax=Deinococcus rubellus TaxID=1889240 RepID=A0ABY5YEI8_9DEIO|nr:undecaprenyl-diphosphate phosphatase [Deinococcus rubellus]UWX62709.1 undecaprenyl-diphosphate phosphatase [Deinococcus rubellus]
MDWLYSIILGIVEGLTEFLPVSSTGHLIVAGDLLRVPWPKTTLDTFEVVIQGGAILAVVVYYWRDLVQQARTINKDAGVQRLWLGIVVACIPAVILGVLFGNKIKALLFTPTVVAWALIVGGVLMYLIELRPRPATTHKLESINLRQAIIIGAAQCLALLWPGFSRSASSILGGMLTGLDRPTATKFSFYLGIPVLGGATLLDFVKHRHDLGSAGVTNVGIGFVVSFIVAYFVIGWLLRFISTHNFKGFAVYRIIAGIVILGLIASGVIHNVNRA